MGLLQRVRGMAAEGICQGSDINKLTLELKLGIYRGKRGLEGWLRNHAEVGKALNSGSY